MIEEQSHDRGRRIGSARVQFIATVRRAARDFERGATAMNAMGAILKALKTLEKATEKKREQ